jgi:nucleotide-binding universal stress UspA family protein
METRAIEPNVMRSKPYVVLVGMDFSEPADRALRKALELSAQRENSELHVACIVPHGAPKGRHPSLEDRWIVAESAVIEGVLVSLRAHVRAELEAFSRRLELRAQCAPKRVISQVLIDAPGLGLAQLALEIAADVIVMGARGQGRAEHALGSVARSTLSLAPCTVLLTQAEDLG